VLCLLRYVFRAGGEIEKICPRREPKHKIRGITGLRQLESVVV
jgi:hypothetical protein